MAKRSIVTAFLYILICASYDGYATEYYGGIPCSGRWVPYSYGKMCVEASGGGGYQSSGCPSGTYSNGQYCIPNGAIACPGTGGRSCPTYQKCTSVGGCIPLDAVDCGDGQYCRSGQVCLEGRCGNRDDASVCDNDTYCLNGKTCWRTPYGIPNLEPGLRCVTAEEARELDKYVVNTRRKEREERTRRNTKFEKQPQEYEERCLPWEKCYEDKYRKQVEDIYKTRKDSSKERDEQLARVIAGDKKKSVKASSEETTQERKPPQLRASKNDFDITDISGSDSRKKSAQTGLIRAPSSRNTETPRHPSVSGFDLPPRNLQYPHNDWDKFAERFKRNRSEQGQTQAQKDEWRARQEEIERQTKQEQREAYWSEVPSLPSNNRKNSTLTPDLSTNWYEVVGSPYPKEAGWWDSWRICHTQQGAKKVQTCKITKQCRKNSRGASQCKDEKEECDWHCPQ